jgi:hypothetical protein
MNLADLANFACTATGYVDPDDQAAVRTFLLARDRMIYDAALWKSALLMTVIALDPLNNPDHAEGIVPLPEEFQRPVGVRTTDNAVRVNAIENYFRFDADKFTEHGTPFEFAELQPIFGVWRGISSIAISCDAGENDVEVKMLYRDHSVVKTAEFALMKNGVGNIKLLTPSGSRVITLSNAGEPLANGDYTFHDTLAGPVDFAYGRWENDNGYLLVCTGNGTDWLLMTPDSSTILYSRKTSANVWGGLGSHTTAGLPLQGALPAPTAVFPDAARIEILAVYKNATQAPLNIGYSGADGALTLTVLGSVDPERTVSPGYPRLRLFGIPNVATNLRVLGKGKYQPLNDDRQEQTVRNSENCLLAFARGDLLRRGGENGAAQLAYQEAAALLQQLKDVEAVQAAHNQRIIPDEGYGPEWGLGPYIRPYF